MSCAGAQLLTCELVAHHLVAANTYLLLGRFHEPCRDAIKRYGYLQQHKQRRAVTLEREAAETALAHAWPHGLPVSSPFPPSSAHLSSLSVAGHPTLPQPLLIGSAEVRAAACEGSRAQRWRGEPTQHAGTPIPAKLGLLPAPHQFVAHLDSQIGFYVVLHENGFVAFASRAGTENCNSVIMCAMIPPK